MHEGMEMKGINVRMEQQKAGHQETKEEGAVQQEIAQEKMVQEGFGKRDVAFQALQEWIGQLAGQDVCLAFSGGVDSSLLLKLLCDGAGIPGGPGKIYAVTFRTRLHSLADMDVAQSVAEETGAIHCILEIDESENQELLENPLNRCYLCKRYLFRQLKDFAASKGVVHVMDGTNADDLKTYRPGLKALRELEIQSPLAELGIGKAEVRRLAKELGLSVAERPSAPCLATRLPYGDRMDFDLFRRIDEGEQFLKNLGFQVVRLRVHKNIARLEVSTEDFQKFLGCKEDDNLRRQVITKLKSLGFDYITLDLEGFRSGSMDIHRN